MLQKTIISITIGFIAFSSCLRINDKDEDMESSDSTKQLFQTILQNWAISNAQQQSEIDDTAAGTSDTTETSNNITLKNIVLNNSALEPSFQPDHYYYRVNYDRTDCCVWITLIPEDADSKLKINGTHVYPFETYVVPLLSDEEYIDIEVYNSTSGLSRSYLVIVNRVNNP